MVPKNLKKLNGAVQVIDAKRNQIGGSLITSINFTLQVSVQLFSRKT